MPDPEAHEEHEAQRCKHDQPFQRGAKQRDAKRRKAYDGSGSVCDDGRLIGQPGDHAGECDAASHVVVDADHVGAQAHIVDDRAIGRYAARRGIVPVEIRHRCVLSYAQDGLLGGRGAATRRKHQLSV